VSAECPGDLFPREQLARQVYPETGRQQFLHELTGRPGTPLAAVPGERRRGDQLRVGGEACHHRGDVVACPGPLEGERGQEFPGLLLAVRDQVLDEQRVAVQEPAACGWPRRAGRRLIMVNRVEVRCRLIV
jgi:hypothetical protein